MSNTPRRYNSGRLGRCVNGNQNEGETMITNPAVIVVGRVVELRDSLLQIARLAA